MKNRFVPKTTQGEIYSIDQLVTDDGPGIQKNLGARKTILLKEIFLDAACSGARIFWTPREVRRTGRDGSTPQDVNTSVATSRLTLHCPNLIGTSNFPTRTGTQDIVSPRRYIIPQETRNADPLDAPINQFSVVHGHTTPIFRKIIGPKIVPDKSADVYARKRMDFASNSVVSESTKFMDFRRLPDKHNG